MDDEKDVEQVKLRPANPEEEAARARRKEEEEAELYEKSKDLPLRVGVNRELTDEEREGEQRAMDLLRQISKKDREEEGE